MNNLPAHFLRLGTRTSKLALWQTDHIIHQLEAAWPGLKCEKQPFVTRGDKTLDRALPDIGGKGLFTAELEQALRDGDIDMAVHSLKDLPVENAAGLTLGAITSRADVRDGLVARQDWTLDSLPRGATVGTSSIRRQAQLLAIRPDLNVRPIRGNVNTRVRKVQAGEYDAAVMAIAGLQRLGLTGMVTQWLELDEMLPAPGQGALAVQCRADDEATLRLLAAIDDPDVRKEVTAERAFLDGLGGGCSAPVAAYATVDGLQIHLDALVASPDGKKMYRVAGNGDDAWALGLRLSRRVIGEGAGEILRNLETGAALKPLHGKRIVVTRSRAQATALSRRLSDLGAIPIEVPMIRIVPMLDPSPVDQAVEALPQYDWIIFTSVNGVGMFWERVENAQQAASGTLRLPKVAAVGPATARALLERGVQSDFIPETFVGEAVARGMGDLHGKRVLLPRAEIGGKALTELLVTRGASVDNLPVYRTLPTNVDATALGQLAQGVDAVTFTSGSTVRNWVTAVGDKCPPCLVACIGPVTAEVAGEMGLHPDLVATEYTTEGLVQVLVDHYQERECV